MKTSTKIGLITTGALLVPLGLGLGVGFALVKGDQARHYRGMEAYKVFNNFIMSTRGRIAGNVFNFDPSILDKSESGIFKGFKLADNQKLTNKIFEDKLLHPYDANNPFLETEKDNLGNYRAYQILLDEIKKMGYKNNNPEEIVYPDQNQISEKEITGKNGARIKVGEAKTSGETEFVKGSRNKQDIPVTIFKNDHDVVKDIESKLTQDGFVTHGFLFTRTPWENKDAKEFNNVGNNVIVTINPVGENKQNPKDFFIVSHYDSMNNIGPEGTSWGAADNATSVSVNLRLLKYFSNEENRKKLGVRLHIIFADAEELGLYGSEAFVQQFLSERNNQKTELQKNALGMINMDTVAGGDVLHVHSPDSREENLKSNPDANVSQHLRDQLHSISRARSLKLNDITQELNIHAMYEPGGFRAGETGDFSDHAPYYLKAKMPIANIEATNYAIYAISSGGKYDGYSMTTNPNAWLRKIEKKDKNGNVIFEYEPTELVETKIGDGSLKTYKYDESKYKPTDFVVTGNIWHSDLDTPQWFNKHFGKKFYQQLDTTYETVISYLLANWQLKTDKDGKTKLVYFE
ncbi:M28 family metallopeptidase [Metamycoplasma alkalescens]|uniref:M28 family metallopeptidase n=1 Tax=Metamycoplasma alkalescens TaxID=45363 RepID=UPI003D079DD3